jgi:hypothetical protein
MNLRDLAGRAAQCVAVLCLALLFTTPAFAADELVGTWKILSWTTENLESKEKKENFGQRPVGMLVFTPQQRILSLITAEGRKPAQTDAERAALLLSMFAVAGRYRVEGGKYIVTIEVSPNPAAIGTEQTRDFKIEGNRLTIIAPAAAVSAINSRPVQTTTVWERVTK